MYFCFEYRRLSDIVHRRHYDLSLRVDQLFKFTKFAKLQQKWLNIVHSLTEKVIQEKWIDIEKKEKRKTEDEQIESKIQYEITENDKNTTANYNLHYVRDDLDDIDESDVGEKKRLAFLEMLIDMKKSGEQMTDEEIWEEVNTIMFEVKSQFRFYNAFHNLPNLFFTKH